MFVRNAKMIPKETECARDLAPAVAVIPITPDCERINFLANFLAVIEFLSRSNNNGPEHVYQNLLLLTRRRCV